MIEKEETSINGIIMKNEENGIMKSVYIIENKIEDEGAKIIGEGLKSNSTLTELNLGCEENLRTNR